MSRLPTASAAIVIGACVMGRYFVCGPRAKAAAKHA
jgi:hypothetical protein